MDQRQPDEPDTDAAAQDDTERLEPAQAGDNAPIGGDQNTENQLEADNAVEEDMLKALDPDAAPG